MRREGLISWLIVTAALALPGGSLYFWLTSTVDAARTQEQSIKRQRDTPIFSAPATRQTLVNPVVRKPEIVVHEDDKPLPPPTQTEPQAAVLPAPAPKPAPAPLPAPTASERPLDTAKQDARPAVAAAWTPARDPMLSPREEAILNAPIPAVDAPAPAPRPVRRAHGKPIQDTISVEAIIALEGAPSAIVNGIAVKVGDIVGKAKVVLITPEAVTFVYRNLRFVKSI